MPKCLARHVTHSPKFIKPEVVPAIASSLVCAVEILCKSILLDKSKQTSAGALMVVVRWMVGMSITNIEP